MPPPTTKDSDLPPLPPEASHQPAPEQHHKTGLLKRFATKFRSPAPDSDDAAPSTPKNKRKTTLRLPSMPKAGPPLANAFTSPEHRQAALRERGLLPSVPHPYKDSHGYMVPLSEQEKYLDDRFAVVPEAGPRSSGDEDEETEAKRIREAWMKKNQEINEEKPTTSSPPDPLQDHSTSERACALAVPSHNLVIGKQQSSSPAIPLGLKQSPNLQPAALVGARDPQDIPLPPSPILPISSIHGQVDTMEQEAPNHSVDDDDDDDDDNVKEFETDMKVAKWLESTPTGSPRSAKSFGRTQGGNSSAQKSLPAIKEDVPSPSSTAPSTIRGRTKEKPSPISIAAIVINTASSSQSTATTTPPLPNSVPNTPPSLSSSVEDPRSPPRQSTLPIVSVSPPPSFGRGRSKTVGETETRTSLSLVPSTSTDTTTSQESRSRSIVPALSPTRTTSSSAASDVLATPITLSRPRNYSASTGSSEGLQAQLRNGKRAVVSSNVMNAGLKVRTVELEESVEQGERGIANVIVESPIESHHHHHDHQDSVPGEFGRIVGDVGDVRKMNVVGSGSEASFMDEVPTPRPRPSGENYVSRESTERRKSITLTSLFASKSHSMGALASEVGVVVLYIISRLFIDLSAYRLSFSPLFRLISSLFTSTTSLCVLNLNHLQTPQTPRQPKLGLASRSMSNLRRSVAGTITSRFGLRRPKSSLVIDTQRSPPSAFDSSRLPPSPSKFPSSFPPSTTTTTSPTTTTASPPMSPSLLGPRAGLRSQTPVPAARPRVRAMPLSPTMHSRGSILMEMHGIEDDESRRLSELAFLG